MHARNELADIEAQIDRMTFDAWKREPGAPAEPRRRLPQATVQRILVATEGSARSDLALLWAESLGHAFRATVTVVTVTPAHYMLDAYGGAGMPVHETERETANEILERSAEVLRRAGVPTDAVLVDGDPAKGVLRVAMQEDADLVVVGSHGHGATARAILGSVADAVRHHAEAHVLVAKNAPPPGRILIPVDGSTNSKLAADLGLQLRDHWGAEATLLHVVSAPVFGPPDEAEALYREAVDDLGMTEHEPKLRFELQFGRPGERIAALARGSSPALVVMGTRGLSGLQEVIGGSVSARVAHEAEASVLLARAAAPPERRGRDRA